MDLESVPIRALIVEDEADDAALTIRALQTCKTQVQTIRASTIRDAVDLMHSRRIDLVVLDLGLPDSVSEFAGLTTILRADDQVPVICVTGSAPEDAFVQEAIEAGATALVFKDHGFDAVAAAVDRVFQPEGHKGQESAQARSD